MSADVSHMSDEVRELLTMALSAYGHSRGYWCRYCKGHVVEGHTPACPLVLKASYLVPTVQVTQEDNTYYDYHAYEGKSKENVAQ